MNYEILRLVTIHNLTVPVSFTPPLKLLRLDVVTLVAPIIERHFGPVEVRVDGKPFEWRKAKGAQA